MLSTTIPSTRAVLAMSGYMGGTLRVMYSSRVAAETWTLIGSPGALKVCVLIEAGAAFIAATAGAGFDSTLGVPTAGSVVTIGERVCGTRAAVGMGAGGTAAGAGLGLIGEAVLATGSGCAAD